MRSEFWQSADDLDTYVSDYIIFHQDGRAQSYRARFRSAQPCQYDLTNCLVAPQFLLKSAGKILFPFLHHNFAHAESRYKSLLLTAATVEPPSALPNNLVINLIGGHYNFYHFMTNFLCRAYYYRESIENFDNCMFVVMRDMPPVYYDFLCRVGVPRERMVSISAARYTRLPSVIAAGLPHYFDEGLQTDIAAFSWLRERLGVNRVNNQRRERLFLSRSRAVHRRVLNEDALAEIAVRRGFVRIYPEDYTLDELLALLSRAETLITPYGAGATNSLLCPSDCTIIELAGLSALKKLNTIALTGAARQRCVRVMAEELDLDKPWAYRNIIVNSDIFEAGLDAAQNG